jgi:ribosomal protein S18 acetylase RimI-like enzyme
MERREIQSSFYTNKLNEKGFSVIKGWGKELAQQLVVHSREDAIKRWTPRDATERFPSVEAAKAWYNKNEHIIYALGSTAQLAGVMWFTRYEEPEIEFDNRFTMAVRMYDDARGRGLSYNFGKATHLDLEQNYSGDVWLETDVVNKAALHLYHKLNYEETQRDVANSRIVMVRPGVASRLRDSRKIE